MHALRDGVARRERAVSRRCRRRRRRCCCCCCAALPVTLTTTTRPTARHYCALLDDRQFKAIVHAAAHTGGVGFTDEMRGVRGRCPCGGNLNNYIRYTLRQYACQLRLTSATAFTFLVRVTFRPQSRSGDDACAVDMANCLIITMSTRAH